MKFIKHKNMRDVCAQVLEDCTTPKESFHTFKICWINRLGTVENPEPFLIGSGSNLAIESVLIEKSTFERDWEVLSEP